MNGLWLYRDLPVKLADHKRMIASSPREYLIHQRDTRKLVLLFSFHCLLIHMYYVSGVVIAPHSQENTTSIQYELYICIRRKTNSRSSHYIFSGTFPSECKLSSHCEYNFFRTVEHEGRTSLQLVGFNMRESSYEKAFAILDYHYSRKENIFLKTDTSVLVS